MFYVLTFSVFHFIVLQLNSDSIQLHILLAPHSCSKFYAMQLFAGKLKSYNCIHVKSGTTLALTNEIIIFRAFEGYWIFGCFEPFITIFKKLNLFVHAL